VIRVAAVGDLHIGKSGRGRLGSALENLSEAADVLLLAGDLTDHGTLDEATVVAEEFSDLGLPVIAVLGNHDHHGDAEDQITELLGSAGICLLEGSGTVVDLGGHTLGVAGVKGFGGGFAGRSGSDFGEREMKSFIGHTIERAASLDAALGALPPVDVKIALTHYAPTPETLAGEPLELYPFLGAYQLAEAIDANDVDLAIHGHAHYGCAEGATPGGVPVRNVAKPVIGAPYRIYRVTPGSRS
jgi:Icc-related predicted phosphoesterase